MTEVNGSGEDVTQDEDRFGWGQAPLAWTLTPMCLWIRSWRHVVCCVWKKCVVVGNGSCVEEGQGDGGNDDEAMSEPMLSFKQVLRAFVSMRAFMDAHDITKKRSSEHC
jgi:hypothetical protein